MKNIKISHGKTRLVIQFPKLGFVLKIAKSSPLLALTGSIKHLNKNLYLDSTGKYWFRRTSNIRCISTLGYELFKGLDANTLENRIWKKYKFSFLEPTYFSFFGLVNIQKFVNPLGTWDIDPEILFKGIIGYASKKDAHTLFVGENFTKTTKGFRLIDYGSINTTWVLLRYHKELKENMRHI